MKRKLVLLGAVMAVIIGLLAGCGGNISQNAADDGQFSLNLPGFPLSQPMTVSIMGPHAGVVDWDEMPFWHAISEATNMNFQFTTPPNQDFLTNLNLAFAADNLPDVLFGASLTATHQIEHGAVGTLIPLQDLIRTYAPNIQNVLDAHPHIRNSITAPDGNIYALPTINLGFDAIWPVGPVYYNGLWMDALGAEVPRTLDEFTALMFRFRDEMPEILGVDRVWPISATDEMVWLRVWMLSFFGMTSRAIEATDGIVVHNTTTDAYRAFIEWMNMLFNEGIVHPEIYSLSGDQHNALGASNLVGFFQSWHSYGFLQTDQEQALRNPMLRPIVSEWSPNGVLPRSPGFSIGQLAITSNAQNPGEILRMFDFLYTEEGAVFANHGPEGHWWVYDTHAVTGQQVRVLAPGVDPEDGMSRGRVTPFFGFPAPQLIPPYVPRVLDHVNIPIEATFVEFLESETRATMEAYGKVNFPPTMLLQDEADIIAVINADLNLEINMREAQFITGITPINDDTWADFQDTLVQIGINSLVEVWQAAHDRWLAAAQ